MLRQKFLSSWPYSRQNANKDKHRQDMLRQKLFRSCGLILNKRQIKLNTGGTPDRTLFRSCGGILSKRQNKLNTGAICLTEARNFCSELILNSKSNVLILNSKSELILNSKSTPLETGFPL